MRTMPIHEYGGYTVVANALPAPNNRYYSTFSIHEYSPTVSVLKVPVIYQEGISANITAETAQQAHEDALERAIMWIDAHPLEGSDANPVGRKSLNPWEHGDYRIYGFSLRAPAGGFFPVYSIDRFRGTEDAPRLVVDRCVVESQICPTEDLARLMAIEHGKNRLQVVLSQES